MEENEKNRKWKPFNTLLLFAPPFSALFWKKVIDFC